MSPDVQFGIHWFRRDLRIAGNENLRFNWKQNRGRVLGLFCFDAAFLARPDFSPVRFAFFLKTLRQLQSEMREQGGDLLVVDEAPEKAFSVLLQKLKPALVTWGRDYEPYARRRDENINRLLADKGIRVHTGRDHLLFEPHEVLKDDGGFYQVYSPYFKKWSALFHSPAGQVRLQAQAKAAEYYTRLKENSLEKIFSLRWSEVPGSDFKDALSHYQQKHGSVSVTLPPAGFAAGWEQLESFSSRLQRYGVDRDIPSIEGTSRTSVYQKNGSLVSSQILYKLGSGSQQFMKEIAWREFYYSILYHRPDCEKHTFLQQYDNLAWENNREWFERWCTGETGFPIVDAGMRQLNTTGWMHNRVRMIVASFLTKDLLIDWRWGENYFMQKLLDGDLAPNNGGWQWAASTGCDPQPYFRIFNPWLQAAKFDPEAEYIKTYVPELKNFSAKAIHTPDGARGPAYPLPIVDHARQKPHALRLFNSAKKI